MPRSFGDGIVHESHFDAMVSVDVPLSEVETKPMSPEEAEIGRLIAENLVEDGATIQMGKLLKEFMAISFLYWMTSFPSLARL